VNFIAGDKGRHFARCARFSWMPLLCIGVEELIASTPNFKAINYEGSCRKCLRVDRQPSAR
jgi:hypothetical protein